MRVTASFASLLKTKFLNGWFLFWLISIPISVQIVSEMLAKDMSLPADVSHMIGFAVRFAIPIIFIVFATSALQILYPNLLTRWLMRNRKYIGLTFAVAMFWQGVFIAHISIIHRSYYFENIFYFKDELEGTIGYLLLGAMVVTSFYFARQKLDKSQWDLIHKSGMYFLWAYPFSTYWWATSNYYGDGYAEIKHYSFYFMGLAAVLLRIAGWHKNQSRNKHLGNIGIPNKILGNAFITIGLGAAMLPMYWQPLSYSLLYNTAWSENLAMWLPFYPFEPFIPIFIIWLGFRQQISTGQKSATMIRTRPTL